MEAARLALAEQRIATKEQAAAEVEAFWSFLFGLLWQRRLWCHFFAQVAKNRDSDSASPITISSPPSGSG